MKEERKRKRNRECIIVCANDIEYRQEVHKRVKTL